MALPAETLHTVVERTQRHRALKGGFILNGINRSAVSCTIRDQSETGFGIKAPMECPVPKDFLLWVPVDGKAYRCHMEWRHGDRIGASFNGWEEKPKWMY